MSSRRPLRLERVHCYLGSLNDGVGEQAVGELLSGRLGGRGIARLHDEPEHPSDTHVPDSVKPQQRQCPLDRGGFGIGDSLEGAHLHSGGEPHEDTPHHFEKERPLICS